MADVRSLLRQQRMSRRIEHPHAIYSESGKLSCNICQEVIKAESLWDSHVRSSTHRSKVRQSPTVPVGKHQQNATEESTQSNKRKHPSSSDSESSEPDGNEARKKRSKNGAQSDTRAQQDLSPNDGLSDRKELSSANDAKAQNTSTPTLSRRTSTTPVQGVGIQIPSRPATPRDHRDGNGTSSSTSTPSFTPLGPSPLIPQDENSGQHRQSNKPPSSSSSRPAQQANVDENEWAAFEADIAAASAPYADDATISAPAMTAQEHQTAARADDEAKEKQRKAAEQAMADEKEDASRALESEFEEMEALEARVRRLKEQREALRVKGVVDVTASKPAVSVDKENRQDGATDNNNNINSMDEEDEDEEEDEEDEDDAFMGFLNRG